MNILWISNVLFPEACLKLNLPVPVVGGWMESAAKALLKYEGSISLAVAALYSGDKLKCIEGESIRHYLIPGAKDKLVIYLKEIADSLLPDLVHIHGTEYSHSLAYVKANGSKNVVVSIQGLVSVYANYYLGGLSAGETRPSLRDVFRNDSLHTQQKKMAQRGESEKELLRRVSHVVGRTSWDRSHVWAINPDAHFHHGDETLRASFYQKEWKYSGCQPYSIFLSQAHYPIKGIQQLIKALPLVKRHYPGVKVYVAGVDFVHVPTFRKNGFAVFVEKLMERYGVTENIVFLGSLSEEEMAQQYEKSHVFVCPSAIENSPNSVGEAQLVGVPCIASYVGGSMDMVKDGETGFLYRFEETALLAYRICQLFGDMNLCESLSAKERIEARKRHNSQRNALALMEIYQSVLRS